MYSGNMNEIIKKIYDEKRKKAENDINFKNMNTEQKSQIYSRLFSESVQEAHTQMLERNRQ